MKNCSSTKNFPFELFTCLSIFALALTLAGCESHFDSTPASSPPITVSDEHSPEPEANATATSPKPLTLTSPSPTAAVLTLPASEPINPTNLNQIQLLASLPENPERVYRISADHKLLFVADTLGVDVFDIETKTLIKHFPFGITYNTVPYGTEPSGINESHFAISKDGDIFAVIDFKGVKVISIEGNILFSLNIEMPFLPESSPRTVTDCYSLDLSPDGKYLALSRSTGDIEIIDLSTGQILDTPNLRGNSPRFSPSGELLVTMDKTRLLFWETTNWTQIQDIAYRGYWPLFTFANDETILLHNWSNYVEVWDILHHKRINMINLNEDREKFILLAKPLVSPDGNLFAVFSRDAEIPCFELSPVTVSVFNVNGEKLAEQSTPFEAKNCQPYFLGLNYISLPFILLNSGEIITVSPLPTDHEWADTFQQVDISFPQAVVPPKVDSYVKQNWVGFESEFEPAPNGQYVAFTVKKGSDTAMGIYDSNSDSLLYWGNAAFSAGSFSPDSTIFIMTRANVLTRIDLSSQDVESTPLYENPRLVPNAPLAISPDNRILTAVIARDAVSETVIFLDAENGSLLSEWFVGNDEVKKIKFSEDGKYVIVATYGGWINLLGISP